MSEKLARYLKQKYPTYPFTLLKDIPWWYFLILFLPIFGISQSKKSLKETVIQYQDSITILSDTTEYLRKEILEIRKQ